MATLDWYGCATFRLRTGGRRSSSTPTSTGPPGAPGTGLTADDVDECDWIVIGHAHFDHLYGAERIMARTAATLIGSYETVRVMEAAGVPLDRMICVAGGERIRLADDVTVSVLPSQHSCVWSHSGMAQSDEVCLGDLGVTWQEQRERMRGLQTFLTTRSPRRPCRTCATSARGHSARGDGGALLYLFETPEGSLLYQDTSGHWSGILDGLAPTSRSSPRPAAATSTASRSRARSPSSSPARSPRCGRAGCSSATTTTGCPGSRWRPTWRRCARRSPPSRPTTELLEPGYLAATDVFG